MQPSVQLITLGVSDLDEARRFYVDGLGWPSVLDVPGEVVFIQLGPGQLLSLFSAAAMDADLGRPGATAAGFTPFTLAQVVATEDDVRAALDAASAAGATIVKPPQYASFGGFHGYFADPSGFLWEVATNSGWHVADDGTVDLRPIEPT